MAKYEFPKFPDGHATEQTLGVSRNNGVSRTDPTLYEELRASGHVADTHLLISTRVFVRSGS